MLGSRATYIIQGKNMYGIPKILQTRADFDFCLVAAKSGTANPHDALQHFRGLISSAQAYVFDKTLVANEPPSGKQPDYFVSEEKDEEAGEIVRTQYRMGTDNSARIFSLGYTIDEVTAIITDLETLIGY